MIKLPQKLLRFVGYPVFALVMFFLCFYLTFPYEKLKGRIEDLVNAQANGEYEVKIGDIGASPLFGVSAKKVVIKFKAPPPAIESSTTADASSLAPLGTPGNPRPPGEPPQPLDTGAEAGKDNTSDKPAKPKALQIVLDEVSVSTGIIAILTKGVDVSFDIEGFGGSISGSYEQDRKRSWELSLKAKKIDLKKIPFLMDKVGLPFAGEISSRIELEVPGGKWSEAKGKISIDGQGLAIGDGKALLKIPGNALLAMGLTLPKVALGTLGGEVSIEKGQGTLHNFAASSSDMELKLDGTVSLRTPVPYSTMQSYLTFKLNPELKKRDPKFDLVESGLSNAKRPDGFFGMRIEGVFKSPRFIPSSAGPAPSPGSPPGAGAPHPPPGA